METTIVEIVKATDIPKSRLDDGLNGILNIPGCLNAERTVVSTGKSAPDKRYAQTRVRSQDWTTSNDQREERDGCQHGQRHCSESRKMTNCQSQSPLKIVLQRKGDEET